MADTVDIILRLQGERIVGAKFRKTGREAKKFGRDVEDVGRKTDRTTRSFRGLNDELGLTSRAMRGLLIAPMVAAGIGVLAQVVGVLAGGVLALGGAIAPVSGGLIALPAIGLAAKQGLSILQLAFHGVTDAVGGLNEAMDEEKVSQLSPAAQDLAIRLDDMKSTILRLQEAAQAGLFPGVEQALATLEPVLAELEPLVLMTAAALGVLADAGGQLVASWSADGSLHAIGRANVGVIEDLGWVAMTLADAFVNVLLAARPLIDWMTQGLRVWADQVYWSSEAARESGRLAAFFDQVRLSMEAVGGVVGPLAGAMGNVFAAGLPAGMHLLDLLGDAASEFEKWTASPEGQETLKEWFEAITPSLVEFGRLVRDVGKEFLKMAADPEFAPLLEQIRKELVPALSDFIVEMTKHAPELLSALVEISRALVVIAESGLPEDIAAGVSALARGVGFLIDLPVVGQMLAWGLAFGALWKVFTKIPGVKMALRGLTSAVMWFLGTGTGVGLMTMAWTGLAAAGAALLGPLGLVALAVGAVVGTIIAAVVWSKEITDLNWKWKVALVALLGPLGWLALGVAYVTKALKHQGEIIDWAREKWDWFVGFITDPERMASAAKGMWAGLKSGLVDVLNWVIARWNDFAEQMSFDPPGPGPKFELPTIDPISVETDGSQSRVDASVTQPGRGLLAAPRPRVATPADVPKADRREQQRRSREPRITQVVLNGRVLAEAMDDEVGDELARR